MAKKLGDAKPDGVDSCSGRPELDAGDVEVGSDILGPRQEAVSNDTRWRLPLIQKPLNEVLKVQLQHRDGGDEEGHRRADRGVGIGGDCVGEYFDLKFSACEASMACLRSCVCLLAFLKHGKGSC